MISTTAVSIIVLLVWGFLYTLYRKRMFSSKLFYVLLLIMGSAGLFFRPLPLMGLAPDHYRVWNVILFAFLIGFTFLPWLNVDKLFKTNITFFVKDNYIETIKSINICLIIVSIYSILYSLPYAINATALGADTVRTLLADDYMMPKTIFTTFAVGFASFAPIDVLMFYISLIDNRLKKYSVWLALASSAIMVTNAASAARDAFIFIPLTYVCFYLLFKNSIADRSRKKLKRFGLIALLLPLFVLGGITFDRFFNNKGAADRGSSLLYGTWGYFYQQPYVFDHIIDYTTTFYGFERRLKFLDGAFDVRSSEYIASQADKMDYMFGSMYAEFYQINGYSSLIIGFLLYIFLFGFILSSHFKKKKYFSLLLAFCVYFVFTVSGLFYFRYGGNNSEFLFYMGILLITFFIPNIITIKKT